LIINDAYSLIKASEVKWYAYGGRGRGDETDSHRHLQKDDDLLDESETAALMRLSEESISELYKDETDLYSVEDLKVRYK
jgi:hypothetical protein